MLRGARKGYTFMNKLQFVPDGQQDIENRKKSLRAYMKTRRAEVDNRDVKERLLIENVCTLLDGLFPETAGAGMGRTVFVYLSYSSEAPTDKLIETLEEKGYAVYCPRVDGKDMLAAAYGEAMSISDKGIREPVGAAYTGKLDVAIVPLLAVDINGNRLGYGGGYYDRFFAKNTETVRVAYCFETQVQKSVPYQETDEKMQYIVTENNIYSVSGK